MDAGDEWWGEHYFLETRLGERREFGCIYSWWYLPDAIRGFAGWPEVMHAATFLAWLCMRHGVAGADELLGDYGLLHQLAHFQMWGHSEGVSLNDVANQAAGLQERLRAKVGG